MYLKVDLYKPYYCNSVSKRSTKISDINFCGVKKNALRNIGYSLLAVSMMACVSCNNNGKPLKNSSEKEQYDREKASLDLKIMNEPKKYYHYDPSDNNNIDANSYSWTETVFPDGSVKKDSLGYQISIDPQGLRTVVHSETDEAGNTITETELPDSTKIVKTEYQSNDSNEVIQTEQIFWPNGNIKENRYYSEHPADSSNINSQKIKENKRKEYNENGVLIYWESNSTEPESNDSNNIYDKHGRIVYDDVRNEKFQYKGKNKIPYRSTSECDDCLRITEYNKDGSIKKIFFKASDGTITDL